MPPRIIFGEDELEIVKQVFQDAWDCGIDFGFEGKYEKLLTDRFCEFQGGGYCDAVSSGTAAIYVALRALNLPRGCDVVVSPITNPGNISPVLLQDMNVVIADSQKASFLVNLEEIKKVITPNTKALLLTHTSGFPISDIEEIARYAKQKGIYLIEDCSQAHGADVNGKKVGTFGDIGCFSTMYSKTLAAGGSSGLIYAQNKDLYWLCRAHADRGKNFRDPNFNQREMNKYLFPALNFNSDELSSAIGYSVLSRLEDIVERRLKIARKISNELDTTMFRLDYWSENVKPSIFHLPICMSGEKNDVVKRLLEKGIWINPHHQEVACEWGFLREVSKPTPNATDFRNGSFNLLMHENFDDELVNEIIDTMKGYEQ